MRVLHPGCYLIEMTFTREVEIGTLKNSLHAMGFSEVAFDLGRSVVGAMLFRPAVAARPPQRVSMSRPSATIARP
jgi:hypothetical protein